MASQHPTQSTCEVSGCTEPATYRFGVEALPGVGGLLAYVQGEGLAGRQRFPGDTIHVCQPHAKTHVYDVCHEAEVVRMLHGC